MINIDLNKAKDIWKNIIRFNRAPLLEKLDIDFLKALETNNTEGLQNIIRIKNELRNAPNDIRIETANSISELETINNPQNLIDMYSSTTH